METPQQQSPASTMEQLETPSTTAPSTEQQGQQTSGQTPPSEGQSGSGEVSTPPKTGAESLVGLSREQFQELLGQIKPAASAPAQPEKTWTIDEFNKAFNVMQIDPATLQALGYDEDRLPVAQKHYETLRDGIVRQALTMAEYVVQQRMEQMQQRFAPMEQVLQEQQMNQMKQEFFTKYPDLQGLDELCLMARDQLIKEGKKFSKREDAFQAIAEGAKALVKKLTGGAAGNGAAAAPGQGKPTTTVPSTVSAGGQGGVGSAGSTAAGKKPGWQAALE